MQKEKKRNLKNGFLNQSYLVDSAGVILIWPFLNDLFLGFNWLTESRFNGDFARQKAIVYLHYLVFNELPKNESQLIFNKIICGAKPDEVIELSSIRFSDDEIAEGNNLKSAVIQNWPIIKTTSAEGLTYNFLCRNGKLNCKGNDWEIDMEQKSFDILLDRLPWAISIIKLPWNNHFIYVNW